MPATPITATPTAEQMPQQGGGLYTEIEVPGDYEVVLREVDDYDKGENRKGWVFLYDCETPSGGSVEFKFWLSFSQASRWKIFEVFAAHGQTVNEGVENAFNPNAIIGTKVGAHIDFPRDKVTGEATSQYRGIERIFALVDAPAEEATPQPVALEAETPESI